MTSKPRYALYNEKTPLYVVLTNSNILSKVLLSKNEVSTHKSVISHFPKKRRPREAYCAEVMEYWFVSKASILIFERNANFPSKKTENKYITFSYIKKICKSQAFSVKRK